MEAYCDSDEEIFWGPITLKEVRKALTLRRRTAVIEPEINMSDEKHKPAVRQVTELRKEPMTFTPPAPKHRLGWSRRSYDPRLCEASMMPEDSVEEELSELGDSAGNLEEEYEDCVTPAPPPSPERSSYLGSPYPMSCPYRRQLSNDLAGIEEEITYPTQSTPKTPRYSEFGNWRDCQAISYSDISNSYSLLDCDLIDDSTNISTSADVVSRKILIAKMKEHEEKTQKLRNTKKCAQEEYSRSPERMDADNSMKFSRMIPERNAGGFLEDIERRYGKDKISDVPHAVVTGNYSLISEPEEENNSEMKADKDGGYLSVLSEAAMYHALLKEEPSLREKESKLSKQNLDVEENLSNSPNQEILHESEVKGMLSNQHDLQDDKELSKLSSQENLPELLIEDNLSKLSNDLSVLQVEENISNQENLTELEDEKNLSKLPSQENLSELPVEVNLSDSDLSVLEIEEKLSNEENLHVLNAEENLPKILIEPPSEENLLENVLSDEENVPEIVTEENLCKSPIETCLSKSPVYEKFTKSSVNENFPKSPIQKNNLEMDVQENLPKSNFQEILPKSSHEILSKSVMEDSTTQLEHLDLLDPLGGLPSFSDIESESSDDSVVVIVNNGNIRQTREMDAMEDLNENDVQKFGQMENYNSSGEFHDTLEEMELMLQMGMDYIADGRTLDDLKIEDDKNEDSASNSTDTMCKSVTQQEHEDGNESMKSSRTKIPQMKNNVQKLQAVVSPTVRVKPSPFKMPIKPVSKKTPLKVAALYGKKLGQYNKIMSPVSAYIHNSPVPTLVKNITPKSGHTTPRKCRNVTPACSEEVWQGIENINTVNVRPVLPVVVHHSVPSVKLGECEEERMPRMNEKMKKLVDTPRPHVVKHEGRVKVTSSPNARRMLCHNTSDPEISLLVEKR
ncbi:hypothetical protein L9F63_015868, partial [Diploptera punctata]